MDEITIKTPKKNLGGGRGPQTDKLLPPSPLQVNVYEKTTFRVRCLYSYLVHGPGYTQILVFFNIFISDIFVQVYKGSGDITPKTIKRYVG